MHLQVRDNKLRLISNTILSEKCGRRPRKLAKCCRVLKVQYQGGKQGQNVKQLLTAVGQMKGR